MLKLSHYLQALDAKTHLICANSLVVATHIEMRSGDFSLRIDVVNSNRMSVRICKNINDAQKVLTQAALSLLDRKARLTLRVICSSATAVAFGFFLVFLLKASSLCEYFSR